MPKLKRTDEEKKQARGDGPEFVEALDRGLRVIQAFSREGRPMTLSKAAELTGLARATVRRILLTLKASGFVHGDDRLFSLTPRVLLLASSYLASNQLNSVMQPLMDMAASEAHEVCSLAVLDGDQVVFIARATPARMFSTGLEIGYRLPAFCTSVGRVLLSRMPDDQLRHTIERMTLTAPTPQTSTDREALIAAISAVRSDGYSLVDGEAEPGFRSISVPIRRYDGGIVAAANIGGHVDRISVDEMKERFLPLLNKLSATVQPLLV
ncbi:helix-turn-helix domain-containing protein [Bradyrhizobium sp. 83012]|uniref:Helix-turn-helix domain-containing protein n=1 Tax=Bradyrhizobium aeschynomenes TaxID=2734909 RepID=A0ABX2CA50_9BRAD|nr:IclR family transcriptional regulator C-terminal domain-containing protein [Bradyrhizobium aeschynomenes]NPU15543.1 helix-turn-helix domain-containing protein [Bradyrhizobium aeschynomenes]NPU65132.1 helix-turn-helix domain-containing protein [Bradyrhizobium aeschynomenes]NPV24266.1 helix-turn-helix domain-containing protein [Bradyrhizobium aeschynomenes]